MALQTAKWIKKDPQSLEKGSEDVLQVKLKTAGGILKDNDGLYIDGEFAAGSGLLGIPTDGSWVDGLLPFTEETKVNDSVDDINEVLAELAPANALTLEAQALTIYNSTTAKYTGYIATQTGASYKTGDAAGSQVSYIIKDSIFNLQTPDTTTRCNFGDSGTVEVLINGVSKDTFNLATSFNEDYRSSSQVYTPANATNGYITISSVVKYNNFRKWQKWIALVNVTTTDLRPGYNYIVLRHTNLGTGTQTSQTYDVWFDNDSGSNPALSGLTVTAATPTTGRYLSGIQYYALNDTVTLSVSGAGLFNNVYVYTNPISYVGNVAIAAGNVPVNDSAVSGLSSPPAVGDTLTLTDKTITYSVSNNCTKDFRMTLTPRDPYGTYTTSQSSSQNILVSTFADGSSGLSDTGVEYFSDEYYRLPLSFDFTSTSAAYTNQWTSSSALSTGNAQCYIISDNLHGLVYPTTNFTSGYKPTQGGGTNYSSFSGDQKYTRCFISPNSKTNASLVLNGVAAGVGVLGASDINVEIKLPTQTAWLDCAKAYNVSDGVGTDGNGCLNGTISYTGGNATINVTFGGKATFDSNNRMYVRVTLRNTNRTISRFTVTGW